MNGTLTGRSWGNALLHARTIAADSALGAELTFLLMTMSGWTCMHTIATRVTQPYKVFKAASLAPKTDEDWHCENVICSQSES